MKTTFAIKTAAGLMVVGGCSAFSVKQMLAQTQDVVSRRSLLGGIMTGLGAVVAQQQQQPAWAQDEVEWDVFNGLIFNYRGNGFNGLDASTLEEPSVPFLEFGDRLKKGQVEFVEFMAPDGDAAYVTFKSESGTSEKPIRIGEGFPIEQHDGYSSPMFVVRALKNYNVPYKFTVAGLSAYK